MIWMAGTLYRESCTPGFFADRASLTKIVRSPAWISMSLSLITPDTLRSSAGETRPRAAFRWGGELAFLGALNEPVGFWDRVSGQCTGSFVSLTELTSW